MANTTILEIPLEILYIIFDRCDTYTIFHSIRYVCKYFYHAVNNYKPHKLDLTSNSRYNFELIFRLTPLNSITSLLISNDKKGRISKFISRIGNQQLIQLRSLALDGVSDKELEHFFKNILTNELSSLSIEWKNYGEYKLREIIVPAIGQFNLKKLCLKNFCNIVNDESMPKCCNIEHFTIGSCSYLDYPKILNRMPRLKKLVIGECTSSYNNKMLSDSDLDIQPQLEFLTINNCASYAVNLRDLEALLSLTPTIHHLKLIYENQDCKPIFYGEYWEKFISSKLPLLNTFEFSFLHKLYEDKKVPQLDTLIASFQTPYWLDKHRFVTCEYNIDSREVRLYTSGMTCHEISTKYKNGRWSFEESAPVFKISSQDNIYRLTKSSKGDKILTTLEISYNENLKNNMHYLEKVLESDKTLTSLTLTSNRISASGIYYLSLGLQKNQTLTGLNFSDTLDCEGAKYLADALGKNSSLTKLILTAIRPSQYVTEILAGGLRNNTSLQTLVLQFNDYGECEMKILVEVFKINKTLVEIDLAENKIGTAGAIVLANELKTNKILTILNLQKNQIGSDAGQHIGNALRENKTLHTLYLDFNPIGSEGMRSIANGLGNNTTLITLTLRRTEIGSDAGQNIGDALRENKTLRMLRIDHNPIGMEGMKGIANGLPNNTALTTLEIGHCQLQSEGVTYLAAGLKQNTTLINLELKYNSIKHTAIEHLADALKHNKTLTRLDLLGNHMECEGARFLAAALEMNTTLITLVIARNRIGNNGARYLADALKTNKTLTTLDLGGDNQI